jgi:lipoyl(octanoyl) transferase
MDKQHVVVCDIGRIEYGIAWDLQKRIQQRLIDAKRADAPVAPPHVLLLVEHPPVFTLGKSGSPSNLVWNEQALEDRGATFVHIDRGGDITFHGPGQIVGYPILDLERFDPDIHRYLRSLEETIIRTIADYGLVGARFKKRTGVWVGPDERGLERKICAFGIRCSRWVTMHGFALNVNTDLSFFSGIVPCGIADRGVTSLTEELRRMVDEAEVRERLVDRFADEFDVTIEVLRGEDAAVFLAEKIPAGFGS